MENKNISKVLLVGIKGKEILLVEQALSYLDVPFETKEKISANLSLSEQGYSLLLLFESATSPGPLEICRAIRKVDSYILITYFANNSSINEKILAFELGIDQFIQFPASDVEVRAILRSQIRRASSFFELNEIKLPEKFLINELEIDTYKKEVSLADKPVSLTPSEYKILEHLAFLSGQTISRSMIAYKIWGYDSEIYEENIKYHICRIRKKIETDPQNPNYIKTVRGIGYRMLEVEQIFTN